MMYYCYVTGGNHNLNFHGWLSSLTISKLKSDGCKVKKLMRQNNN